MSDINKQIEKILEHEPHRVGSHSDDYGGSSDKPCWCNVKPKILAIIQQESNRARTDELSYVDESANRIDGNGNIIGDVGERLAQLESGQDES